MNDVAKIDQALDEALVHLGAIVLRLTNPAITRTSAERRALALSVHEYARFADRSINPRVHQLRYQLEETIKPQLRLISSR